MSMTYMSQIPPDSKPPAGLLAGMFNDDDYVGIPCPGRIVDDARPLWKRDIRFLTHDEERALVARMRVGDAAARSDLINAHWPLCAKVGARYGKSLDAPGSPPDNATSAAMVGLLAAVDQPKFDPSQHRLATYAWHWMRGAVLKEVRESRTVIRYPQGVPPALEVSLDAPVFAAKDGYEGRTVADRVASDGKSPEELLIEMQRDLALEGAIASLPANERLVFKARCCPDPKSRADIAAELGLSTERVRQLENSAVEKLNGCPCPDAAAARADEPAGIGSSPAHWHASHGDPGHHGNYGTARGGCPPAL